MEYPRKLNKNVLENLVIYEVYVLNVGYIFFILFFNMTTTAPLNKRI